MPDAALQFVQLSSKEVEGVFRCNHCANSENQGFKTWTMSEWC